MPAYKEDMATNAELLKNLRLARNLSQADVAEHLGIEQPEVSRWERGERSPSTQRLISLSKLYGVSVEVLAGLQEKSGPPVSIVFRSDALTKENELPERRAELVEVPLISLEVAVQGNRQIGNDEVQGWIWVPRFQLPGALYQNLIALRVPDASMEPVLRPGSIACINREVRSLSAGAPPLPDEIFVVVLKTGEVVFRYISVKGAAYILIPANPALKAYPVIHMDLRKKEGRIVGQAIWVEMSLIGSQAEQRAERNGMF